MLKMDVLRKTALFEGPKIIAPNHPTTVDPIFMLALFAEQTHILVTESAFKVPGFGRYLRAAGHVEVVTENGQAAFQTARRLLRDGHTVVIFPEGALSPLDGGYCKPHTGAARLALLSGAPVIPVGIYMPKKRIHFLKMVIEGQTEIARWYLRGPYAVTIGDPMRLEGDIANRALVRALSERIMQRILRLSQQSAYRLNAAVPWSIRDTAEIPGLS
jgi:1-acyl-sn-glycerol-3-phosphate acyltransferase